MSDEPTSSTVACLGCGKPVDRLRAGHVAIIDGKFVYFCNVACKLAFHEGRRSLMPDDVETMVPPRVAVAMPRIPKSAPLPDVDVLEIEPTYSSVDVAPHTLRSGTPSPARSVPVTEARASTQASWVFAATGIAASALTPISALFGASAGHVRVGLVLVAGLCVSARTFAAGPDAARSLLEVAPPLVALGASMSAEIRGESLATSLTLFAAAMQGVWLVVAMVEQRARESLRKARKAREVSLPEQVRVVRGTVVEHVLTIDLRDGDVVRVSAGEVLGVDGTVIAGSATALGWPFATSRVTKAPGELLFAGARVFEGEIDIAATTVASHLGEEDSLFVRRLLQFVAMWSPVLSILVGAVVRLNSGSWELGFAVAAAVLMTLQCKGFLLAARQLVFSISRRAEEAGIRFRDIVSYEYLGRVDACAFSARGVVYAGLPEVTEVHAFGGGTEEKVLQLAAAVAGYADETIHQGLERALKGRGLPRETVRGVRSSTTGAISALDEAAQRIVFGTRSQLVEEKLSVAIADEIATAHEEQARTVFLVALGDRVIGSLVLQSVLRPEVRSAVRSLIDLHVEPILMSEDPADAVAALARGLGITHVRADLPARARANAVRDLATAGRTVAVVGLSKRDAEPMLAAHAAIALDAAGSAPWAATLATTDMRVAVQAISLPRNLREQLPRALLVSLFPPLVALGLATFDLVHLALVPLATLAGLGTALLYARAEPQGAANPSRPAT